MKQSMVTSSKLTPPNKDEENPDVDFGTPFGDRYRGMNPMLVERVWAQRRKIKNDQIKTENKKQIGSMLEMATTINKIGYKTPLDALVISADLHGVCATRVKGSSRGKNLIKARHAAFCAVALKYPDMSYVRLGKAFNKSETAIRSAIITNGIRKLYA